MSTQICNPCAEGQVCLDNLDRYSLQDDVYYFVLNCPPDFFCGGNNVMYLVCCDGTIEQTTFTAGMTAAQRQAAISALVGRCLMKDAFCTGTDTDPNNGDGTNGRPGTDPNDPLQLYGNRPMSSTSYCADGSPFTYTVPAGLFFARTQAAADAAARNFARTLSSSLKICLTGPLRTCCNNTAYSSTMVASGGVPGDFRWSISGSLPTGLVAIPIGRNGLRLQGIPTTNGNYTFTVRATDAAGNFMAKVITIKVWGITDATLPDGTLAGDYDYQLTTTNGTAPYMYTLVSGGFPLGVDITSSGLITGVVGEEGMFSPVIRVRDNLGRTCTKEFTLTVPTADDCASISGESTQTWSFSRIVPDGYTPLDILDLYMSEVSYFGFEFEFDGVIAHNIKLNVDSPGGTFGEGIVYLKNLTIASVNVLTGEITFEETLTWPVNAFAAAPCVLLAVDGPVPGDDPDILSNTANSVTVDVGYMGSFLVGNHVAIIVPHSGAGPLSVKPLPVSGHYFVQVGLVLNFGSEDEEWTYAIECDWTPPAVDFTTDLATCSDGGSPLVYTAHSTYVGAEAYLFQWKKAAVGIVDFDTPTADSNKTVWGAINSDSNCSIVHTITVESVNYSTEKPVVVPHIDLPTNLHVVLTFLGTDYEFDLTLGFGVWSLGRWTGPAVTIPAFADCDITIQQNLGETADILGTQLTLTAHMDAPIFSNSLATTKTGCRGNPVGSWTFQAGSFFELSSIVVTGV